MEERIKGDSLGDRMKGYEAVSNIKLERKKPVIIRIDGKAFHTFTRGFNKPFDDVMMYAMQETTKYLCENIQGAVLGYTQSDEITIVVVDYKNEKSSAWFDNKVQKMCSVAASMATMAFNKSFADNTLEEIMDIVEDKSMEGATEVCKAHQKAIDRGAIFDARCFNLDVDEVTNCLIWRQQDAIRNSIEGLGRAYFSHKEMYKKNGEMVKEMLKTDKGVIWEDIPTTCQRGSCVVKETDTDDVHAKWVIDNEIPLFTADRDYIEKLINFKDNGVSE